jgi:hypothetical protein
MKEKRSDSQYYFKVDLKRHESELRGVALLGHQTLRDLHVAISDESKRGSGGSFLFRFGDVEIEEGTRLDDLNLKAGQTFEYAVESAGETRREMITVDFVEDR